MVHASDESSYKKALKPFLDKKKRLAVDVRLIHLLVAVIRQ